MRNAARAIQREIDQIPLFPELVRFKSVEERLDHLDDVQIAYWQGIRDHEAATWRKVRRRLYSLNDYEMARFLAYWNSHGCPGTACNASELLRAFFRREDWRLEDVAMIQNGGAK